MSLKNKNILVMGGSSGIGLAIAQKSYEEGANVTIIGRSKEKLLKAKKLIDEKIISISLDINNEEAIQAFLNKQSTFDHVIMTAGGPSL